MSKIGKPREPPEDIKKLQDPNATEADFLADLAKVIDAPRKDFTPRPSEPDQGSPQKIGSRPSRRL